MTKELILGHLKTNISPNRRNELLRMYNALGDLPNIDNLIKDIEDEADAICAGRSI